MKLPFIQLKAKRNSVHPWIFHKMVARPKKKINTGELVEVYSKNEEFIGRGFYNRHSNINIRLLTEDISEQIDDRFFYNKIDRAVELREKILKLNTQSNSYRLVNAEADLLGGLIIDKFNQVIVIEPLSAGWLHCIDPIVKRLLHHYPNHSIVCRSDSKTSIKENADLSVLDRKYRGPDQIIIQENQLKMNVNLITGHKTGFFLDQRDNRKFISSFCPDKEVLDLCCYSGGFAISAAINGAKKVTAIDLDEKAIETALENSKLNNVNIEFIHQDTFDYLRLCIQEERQYDVVVLDPPKMGRNLEELGKAKKGYNDLNWMAMTCVKNGGVLLTCSCTGSLSEADFLSIITRAANQAGVQLQIFKIVGPSDDHPFMHSFPEGRYLKAIYARVFHVNRTYSPVAEDEPIYNRDENLTDSQEE